MDTGHDNDNDKLNPKHTGPYKVKVVRQTKNDITRIHLADPTIIKEYHVSEVALWVYYSRNDFL